MRWLFLVLLFSIPHPAAAQPSYDCTGRLNSTERAICNSDSLSQLDVTMATAFHARRAQLSGAVRDRLEHEQFRTWLPYRNACGNDAWCLELRYRGRIAELGGQMPGPALGSMEAAGLSISPEGIIERPNDNGSWSLFDPATGKRGTRLADGQVVWAMFLNVQYIDLPALPTGGLGDWPELLRDSLDALAANLLTPTEVATLNANAPPDLLDRLRYSLNAFIYVTSHAP